MKLPRFLLPLLILSTAYAHDHFAVGVSTPGAPLEFIGPFFETVVVGSNTTFRPLQFTGPVGGPLRFVHTDDGTDRVFRLLPRPVGQRYGGYYTLDEQVRTLLPFDYFTLIALSDGQYDDPSPNHPDTGSWIWMEITSVSGPAGARLGFWDENRSFSATTPTRSFATNTPTGGYKFILSEGIDDPSDDPFGHIHNRGWTVDKPGDYYVGFTLYDLSHSGPGGGPIHAKSPTYIFHFVAGPDFSPAQTRSGNSIVLTWPSQMGINAVNQTGIPFTVQRSTTLAPGSWSPLGTVTGTIGNTATFTDPAPPAGNAFYRLQYPWSPP